MHQRRKLHVDLEVAFIGLALPRTDDLEGALSDNLCLAHSQDDLSVFLPKSYLVDLPRGVAILTIELCLAKKSGLFGGAGVGPAVETDGLEQEIAFVPRQRLKH